jgi:hypothetical protein
MNRDMKRLPFLLVMLIVAAGCGAGAAQTVTINKTISQTVTISTTAAADTAQEITARITTPDCSFADADDTFTLRDPGTDLQSGEVVATADTRTTEGCATVVQFPQPTSPFFVVQDETKGIHWGPFGLNQMAQTNWLLRLRDNSSS